MPNPLPPSRPLHVVLHVGTDKTGTSSIQQFLNKNRRRLAELGYLYPRSPGAVRHSRLGLFLKSPAELQGSPAWHRQRGWPGTPPESDPARFRRVFRRRLFAEMERSGLSTVVFSDEALSGCSDPALRRLRSFTDRIAESVRVVIYLRRQDDHLLGRYQQAVKVGSVARLGDWAPTEAPRRHDYHARLVRLERFLDPTRLVVRRFEPDSFVNGSLYQDFLHAAGLEVDFGELRQTRTRNESLDADSLEFLRLVNLLRVENEGATAGRIDNQHLIGRLAQVSTGPTLTLPAPVLDSFMARWEESNRRTAREYLGDETGQLFRTPRKTRNTTTEQRLDPVRIDDFLALVDLPEPLHVPLRRLAEREAGSVY